MAKKRVPKYMLAPVQKQTVVSKSGNPEKVVSFDIPVLKDGTIQFNDNGELIRENVTEIYTWNQDHRKTLKANKGCWVISEELEEIMFEGCRCNGLFKVWKGEKHMGWNVLDDNGSALVIGKGIDNEGNHIDVRVGKFVEGNKGRWHGYPIDYRHINEDIICDNALFYWMRLNVIDKSEIDDIRRKEDSSLL
jgi:hypothetical protein